MNIQLEVLMNKVTKNFSIKMINEAKTKFEQGTVYIIVAEVTLDDNSKTVVGVSNKHKQDALLDLSKKIAYLIQPDENIKTNQTNESKEKTKIENKSSIFTKETIKNMNDFKKEKNITDDEKLMSYIRAWNPNIEHKTQLNEELVKEFLVWIKE